MKKYMLLLLLAISVQNIYAQYGYWYKSEFVELKPIPNLPYYYVNSIPSKTKLDIRQIYNSLSAKNDVKLVSTLSSGGYVITSSEYPFVENAYVSELYTANDRGNIIVLPQIAFRLKLGYNFDNIIDKYSGIFEKYVCEKGIFIVDCTLN